MWSLRARTDNTVYLTFDRDRRPTNQLRGRWEIIAAQGTPETNKIIWVNSKAGYLCVDDEEGNVRMLVLEGL
jgi:hypothetical protein